MAQRDLIRFSIRTPCRLHNFALAHMHDDFGNMDALHFAHAAYDYGLVVKPPIFDRQGRIMRIGKQSIDLIATWDAINANVKAAIEQLGPIRRAVARHELRRFIKLGHLPERMAEALT